MRITCPTCAAAYEVPAERLAGGRTVRCARCGSGWTPSADDVPPDAPLSDLAAPPDAVAPEPPAAPAPELPGPEPLPLPDAAGATAPDAASGMRQRLPVLLAWAASVALLAALAWAAVAWQGDVMRAWPPSERLYAALGLLRRQ